METAAQTSIKASELRVGSFVEQNGRVKQVVAIQTDHDFVYVHLDTWENKTHILHVKPIPLTPEILEKCGFSYLGNGSYENGHMFDKIFVYKRNTLSIGIMLMAGGKLSISFNTNFKTNASMRIYEGSEYYLHQLQNLYQALTGEELEVNL